MAGEGGRAAVRGVCFARGALAASLWSLLVVLRPQSTTAQCARARRRSYRLPAVMRKRLVGLRHAVDVVLALERAALLGLGVEQLVGQALGHGLLAPGAG